MAGATRQVRNQYKLWLRGEVGKEGGAKGGKASPMREAAAKSRLQHVLAATLAKTVEDAIVLVLLRTTR